jgi:cytidine deaminase
MSAKKKKKNEASAKSAKTAKATEAAKAAKVAKAARAARAAKAANAARRPAPRPSVDAKLLDRLLEDATRVRDKAYAPYSRYKVGAAIATKSGSIYTGCNVENASFPVGICAERGAITGDGAAPCGVCRQMLVEFSRDLPVAIIALDDETGRVVSLADLLPEAFELKP